MLGRWGPSSQPRGPQGYGAAGYSGGSESRSLGHARPSRVQCPRQQPGTREGEMLSLQAQALLRCMVVPGLCDSCFQTSACCPLFFLRGGGTVFQQREQPGRSPKVGKNWRFQRAAKRPGWLRGVAEGRRTGGEALWAGSHQALFSWEP